MSWSETLLDASFRGVPLLVVDESLQWQRALSEHGTPFKDGDSVVDLGRGARRVPMQLIVYGNNYEIELQNLLRVLDRRGPGELIHPIYGSMNVVSHNVEVKHVADRPDAAMVSLLFVEDSPDLPFLPGSLSSSISVCLNKRTSIAGRTASSICSAASIPWSRRSSLGSVAVGLG